MPHLVAAPDKFAGTASAAEVAGAVAGAARAAGWTADEVPMSDGGEGLLEVLGGTAQYAIVEGPLGAPVRAEWRLRDAERGPGGEGPSAVVEMSRASGRSLLPRPRGEDPLRAGTTGVGQLLVAARDAGARRIVIGCGGSATTDGGLGAVEAVRRGGGLSGVDLVVACDVTTAFRDAAALFGPQKGADPAQVATMTARLRALAERYRAECGVDVDAIPGAGAAGGLAGGLATLGARIVPGFDLVAELLGLAARMVGADLAVTGEGHLDPPSFQGKVPGGVLRLARGHCPVLCIVGGADQDLVDTPPPGLEVISLASRFGATRSRERTAAVIAEVTTEALARFCP
ncbi:MAG TPA: glycerate kinase [Acidimicrobiales bacterium]|nr:glycerate kinase [Acidimicrobiales bacterium]